MFFALSMSTFCVNYINPIGLGNISWRYYIITIAFTTLVLVIIWFTFPETKGLSLEEIATSKPSLPQDSAISRVNLLTTQPLVFDGRDNFDAAVSAVHAIEMKNANLNEESKHVEQKP